MVKIEVLGTGCAKCKSLLKSVEKAVAESGIQAEIVKVLPPWLGVWSGEDVTIIANNVAKSKPTFINAYADLTKKYVK